MTLEAWWPLHDEQANDYSGNGNHGTPNGGPTTGVVGRGGLQAMGFDGTDDYVGLPNMGQFGTVTVAGWFKWDSFVSDQNAIALQEDNDINIWTTGSGSGSTETVEARIYDGSTSHSVPADSNPPTGEWHHYAATWDGSTLRFYIDGQSQGSTSVSSMIRGSYNGNAIAVGYDNSQRHFAGDSADVRIYSRALSSSEIQTLYEWGSADLARPPTDGVARYPLDGDVSDVWGSNDGTTNGGLSWVSGVRGQAASFDEADDYFTAPASFDYGTGFSVSVWMEPETVDNYSGIIGDDEDYAYRRWLIQGNRNNELLRFFVGDGTQDSEKLLTIPESEVYGKGFVHTTFIYDSANLIIYINGVRYAEKNVGSVGSNTTDSIKIGKYDAAGSSYHYGGGLDDVRIYDYALEPHEVHELYRFGTRGRDWREMLVTA